MTRRERPEKLRPDEIRRTRVRDHEEMLLLVRELGRRYKNLVYRISKAEMNATFIENEMSQLLKMMDEYDEFESNAKARSHTLEDLESEFDGLLALMQTSKGRKGMERAFNASPSQLGRAAVKAARKRRQTPPESNG